MTTDANARTLTISGLRVSVVRKAIKNLHLGVYPPDGRVRVAAPLRLSEAAVRVAVIGRLAWIKAQRARFAEQAREAVREFVSGETHYVDGRRVRLSVSYSDGPASVRLRGRTSLVLTVPRGASTETREQLLASWYRDRLRVEIQHLLDKWPSKLGVQVPHWGIRRMKTKWGSCNSSARRITLNLELAKKAPACVEYVVVHELVHLIERTHNERFAGLMDRAMPNWRARRAELNRLPLQHEQWGC